MILDRRMDLSHQMPEHMVIELDRELKAKDLTNIVKSAMASIGGYRLIEDNYTSPSHENWQQYILVQDSLKRKVAKWSFTALSAAATAYGLWQGYEICTEGNADAAKIIETGLELAMGISSGVVAKLMSNHSTWNKDNFCLYTMINQSRRYNDLVLHAGAYSDEGIKPYNVAHVNPTVVDSHSLAIELVSTRIREAVSR